MPMTLSSELPTNLQIGWYHPRDNAEALALEVRCAQGTKYRLRFDRPYFHRRAENFDEWRIVTARAGGMLVGICAGAIKPVQFEGQLTSALFLFDARVDPTVRRSGVAREVVAALIDWAASHAEIGYAYSVGDNEAVAQLGRRWIGAAAAPSYAYLVYPVYKTGARDPNVEPASAETVHQLFLAREGPFGIYCRPDGAFSAKAHVGSWICASGASSAACSTWSNEEIIAEVVERVPRSLALAGALFRTWPINHFDVPHLPRRDEQVRSWYLYDFHATDGNSAAALMTGVAAEARQRGIDYCYIIHRGNEDWVGTLRRQVPRLFAPVIPYSILARTLSGVPLHVHAPYIDIRDV